MIKKLILGTMQTNCHVVYNEEDCFIIDPGANGQKVAKFIHEHEFNVKAILLTHGHFDHIGAVDYLFEKYQCPIYTHQHTLPLLKDIKTNLSFYEQPFTIQSPVIASDDEMQIGPWTIKWYLLEGHCQGSSMIYVMQENAMFSGDVLFAGSIGRYDFPTSSHLQTKQSLEFIKNLEFDARLLPGHGEESTLAFEQQNNPYLKSY